MAQVSVSERERFEELLDPQFDMLFSFCQRMTRNLADAEDLLQDSIYRAFRGISSFRPGTNFRAWMLRIISNTFISRKRSEKRRPLVLQEVEPPSQESAEVLQEELVDAATDWKQVYSRHVEDDVKLALDDLAEEFRLPLLLSSLGGLRYQEISEVLGVPIGTVMSRLFRARQRLKRSLRDYALDRGIAVVEE